jgi:replicative DNA helicase
VPELPGDQDAEEQVLGSMLLDPSQVSVVRSILAPADFTRSDHRKLFEVVRDSATDGGVLDPLLVAKSAGVDPLRVRELIEATVIAENAGRHAKAVREAAQRRRIVLALTDVRDLALSSRLSSEELQSELGTRMESIDGLSEASAPVLLNLNEAFRAGIPQPDWLLPGWIMAGDVALLAGAAGIGKSTLAADLALALSTPRPWAGIEVPAAIPVLYVDEEQGEPETVRCFARLAGTGVADSLFVASGQGIRLDSSMGVRRLRTLLELCDARLLILDSVQQVFGGIDENSANEVGAAYRELFSLRDELGLTILLIHHKKKQTANRWGPALEMVRGSTAHGTQPSTVWVAWPEGSRQLNVRQEKRRGARKESIVLGYSQDDSGSVSISGEGSVDEDDTEIERAADWIMRLLERAETAVRTRDILTLAAEESIKERTVQRALRQLVKYERVQRPLRGMYLPAAVGGNESV